MNKERRTSPQLIEQYQFGPFGEVIRATGPMAKANPFRFSTKYQDDETDMLYYGYRYYSPSVGRWICRDPIQERGGANTYCFVANSPLSFLDPLGLIRYGDDNWGCGLCQCKDVELTFEPGGDFFQLGWYEVGWPATKRWRFGNAIHVKWNVRGDPRFCRYYQDEGRTEVKWQVVSPSVFPEKTAKGVDGQTVPQIYTDYLGFDIPPLGVTMTFAGKINITFRCVDSEPFSATKTRTIMKTVPPINVRSDEVPRHPLEDMVIK